MTGPGFLIVPQDVARNPVARAISRKRIQQAMRDFAIQIYSLQPGQYVASELQAAAKVLFVALAVAKRQGLGNDEPKVRVMNGGMSAIAQISERGWRWRLVDATALDMALRHAQQLVETAQPADLQRAWVELEKQ